MRGASDSAKESVNALFRWAKSAILEAQKNKTVKKDYETLREALKGIENNKWIESVLDNNKDLKEDLRVINNTIQPKK